MLTINYLVLLLALKKKNMQRLNVYLKCKIHLKTKIKFMKKSSLSYGF